MATEDKAAFTHFDEQGNARMVDVSEKRETVSVAEAAGNIKMSCQGIRACEKRLNGQRGCPGNCQGCRCHGREKS